MFLRSARGDTLGKKTQVYIPIAKFLVPDWGHMVDSGMGYRLPSLCNPADRHDSLMPESVESTISPNQGLGIWPLPQALSIRNTSNRIDEGLWVAFVLPSKGVAG